MYFSEATEGNPRWFKDNSRLLVSVWGKAYKQSYQRGVYIIETEQKNIKGPLVEIASRAFLGNSGKYFLSDKYVSQDEPLSGNFIRYDFTTGDWHWITDYPSDSLNRWVKLPRPNPKGREIVFSKYTDNAWQLFMMDPEGANIHQLTHLGGSEVNWSKNGDYVCFNRDTHKAPGAHYISYRYELATGDIEPVWSSLPDSVPQFPPLETQDPIDFLQIVRDSTSNTNSN